MKVSEFLVLFFFLFTFTITSFPSVIHAEDPEAVVDVFNQKVRAGARYFLKVPSDVEYNLGGLAVSDSSRGSCPSDVVLSSTSHKLPVIISPVESKAKIIQEDTHLTVKFGFRYLCRMMISLVWTVDIDESTEPQYRVTPRGTEGADRFMLTKYDSDHNNLYQLSYCPTSETLEGICFPIGYVVKDGVTYLAAFPVGRPFPIMLRPAGGHDALDMM